MASTIGELAIKLGFDVDSKALQSFDASVKSLSKNMLEVLGVTGITAYGINQFARGAFDGAQNMRNLAQGTNIATAELQKYAAVANILNPNISAEGAADAISGFDRRLNAFRQGLGPAPNAQALRGVEIGNNNAVQIINKLRDAYRGLSNAQKATNLEALGLPKELLNVLNATPDQFEKIATQVSLTEDQMRTLADASKTLNAAFVELSVMLEQLIAEKLKPFLQALGISTKEYHAQQKATKKQLDDNDRALAAHGYIRGDNNLGNIRSGPYSFKKFNTPEEGFAAVKGLLKRYQAKGYNTISDITNRWAPFMDHGKIVNPANNPFDSKYQKFVASRIGKGVHEKLDFNDPALLDNYAHALIRFEKGHEYVTNNKVVIHHQGKLDAQSFEALLPQTNQNAIKQINNASNF